MRGAPELDDAHGVRVNKKLIQHVRGELGISGLPARRRAQPNLINRATSTDLQSRRVSAIPALQVRSPVRNRDAERRAPERDAPQTVPARRRSVQAAVSLPRWIGTRWSSSSNTATSPSRAPSASRY